MGNSGLELVHEFSVCQPLRGIVIINNSRGCRLASARCRSAERDEYNTAALLGGLQVGTSSVYPPQAPVHVH